MDNVIIGIDPDVTRSGFAVLKKKPTACSVASYTFGELVSVLQTWREFDPLVVVEAGWANAKASWHCNPHEPNAVSARKGLAVGRNQQIGHDIVDLCKVYGLRVVEQPPLVKRWGGRDGKIKHDELVFFAPLEKKKTNQEERDALLLAWYASGLPIRARVQN